jgi:hypothetical protein
MTTDERTTAELTAIAAAIQLSADSAPNPEAVIALDAAAEYIDGTSALELRQRGPIELAAAYAEGMREGSHYTHEDARAAAQLIERAARSTVR